MFSVLFLIFHPLDSDTHVSRSCLDLPPAQKWPTSFPALSWSSTCSEVTHMFPDLFLIFHLLRSDPHVSRPFLDLPPAQKWPTCFPDFFLIFHLLRSDPHVSRPFLELPPTQKWPTCFPPFSWFSTCSGVTTILRWFLTCPAVTLLFLYWVCLKGFSPSGASIVLDVFRSKTTKPCVVSGFCLVSRSWHPLLSLTYLAKHVVFFAKPRDVSWFWSVAQYTPEFSYHEVKFLSV